MGRGPEQKSKDQTEILDEIMLGQNEEETNSLWLPASMMSSKIR